MWSYFDAISRILHPLQPSANGCLPALHFRSPTAAGQETTPVTAGRNALLNEERSAADAGSQNGLCDMRPHRHIGVDVDGEVAHDGSYSV